MTELLEALDVQPVHTTSSTARSSIRPWQPGSLHGSTAIAALHPGDRMFRSRLREGVALSDGLSAGLGYCKAAASTLVAALRIGGLVAAIRPRTRWSAT